MSSDKSVMEDCRRLATLKARARKLLDSCIVGQTDNYPGEWAIGDRNAVDLANLLDEILEALSEFQVERKIVRIQQLVKAAKDALLRAMKGPISEQNLNMTTAFGMLKLLELEVQEESDASDNRSV